tara:strand:+ start:690 stop:1088 length:399 start_codon:yes stop_codon:yes gene_type:complete
MAGTKQTTATSLKPGSYLVIDGHACKVTKIDTSRPGKHGHAKCRISATSVFDGSRKVAVLPGHDKVEVPLIEKKNAQILSVTGDTANVMDEESFETFDLEIPEELKGQVKEGVNIIYWDILDKKMMKEVKNG